ncbi:MAG: hypothetical protein JXQ72_07515 [Anaerolineae bacterium]|nr:hypothetical protein [Anaerolineae bacterium]
MSVRKLVALSLVVLIALSVMAVAVVSLTQSSSTEDTSVTKLLPEYQPSTWDDLCPGPSDDGCGGGG